MTVKDKILLDVNTINSSNMLHQIFDFIQQLKENTATEKSNKEEVWKSFGVLPDEDAKEMITIIDAEFNTIEGEW